MLNTFVVLMNKLHRIVSYYVMATKAFSKRRVFPYNPPHHPSGFQTILSRSTWTQVSVNWKYLHMMVSSITSHIYFLILSSWLNTCSWFYLTFYWKNHSKIKSEKYLPGPVFCPIPCLQYPLPTVFSRQGRSGLVIMWCPSGIQKDKEFQHSFFHSLTQKEKKMPLPYP